MDYTQLKQIAKETNPQIILDCANLCDGYTIFQAKDFTEKGLDAEIVENFCVTHFSQEGNPKETLFNKKNQAVKRIRGVYGLDLLRGLAGLLDILYTRKLGRGSQADAIKEAIFNNFKKEAV